jgi:gas vesicle protein
MINIEEVKKWLIANCIDERGNLNISGLDFSDFDGDIDISGMRVKGDLRQRYQKVEGNLNQANQEVKGDLYQCSQKVEGDLRQSFQEVKGDLYQNCQEVKGDLYQSLQKVGGDLQQYCQEVKGNLYQRYQNVKGKMFLQDTSELQKAFDYDGVIYYEKVEKIPEMTLEEIERELGYKFKLKGRLF